MAHIVVYSSAFCPFCSWAKGLLNNKSVEFEEIRIDKIPGAHEDMLAKSNGQKSVPQIFIDDFHVGGFTDLQALDRAGELDLRLQA